MNFLKNSLPFYYSKAQRRGFLLLIILILTTELGIGFFKNSFKHKLDKVVLLNAIEETNTTEFNKKNNLKPQTYSLFNPNNLDEEGWVGLGFSKSQAKSILKYKMSLGGTFINKSQIADSYVISNEKFKEIKAFIRLDKSNDQTTYSSNRTNSLENQNSYNKSKGKIEYQNFDPNEQDLNGWVKLGFSEKQAQSILNYKASLGGSFKNKNQIEKSFVISEEKYVELQPFILLPTIASKNEKLGQNRTENKSNIDLNKANVSDFTSLGIEERKAKRIISFRNILGGFASYSQLKEVYDLSKPEADVIIGSLPLKVNGQIRRSLKDIDEEVLGKHPYTRKYAAVLLKAKKEGKGVIDLNNISETDKRKIFWYFY